MGRQSTPQRPVGWIAAVTLGLALLPPQVPRCPAARPPKPEGRAARGPLRVHPMNPRYFADPRGRAVLLVGSHTWSNLVDIGPGDPPPKFDFTAYLDFLEKHHHNFIRLWTWESVTWNTEKNRRKGTHRVAPGPWARTGPGKALDGKAKLNLETFSAEYFRRLRSRVASARGRQWSESSNRAITSTSSGVGLAR